jgi:hypothetical protein
MTEHENTVGVLTATQLIGGLQVRAFCDDPRTKELTPEQQAAMHAFLHEILAAYYRMRMTVPQDLALAILNKRFSDAARQRLPREAHL